MYTESLAFGFSIWLRFFFLFTPFFALTMFLTLTQSYTEPQRRNLAVRVTCAAAVVCMALFFFGNVVFAVFGITLDAFRVGAGALLFLSAVRLVYAKEAPPIAGENEDVTVVPLAIPIIVGPATTGALLVLGGEMTDASHRMTGLAALILAAFTLGVILFLGSAIERVLGKRGLGILSKITGLVLAALAAQMILMGIQHFFSL
ncbi:MAG: MarC family protein [Kiritimatiellales bacterium]|nr:MarC family protein [Kiritimatiellota bacterium]MBL7012121.1 MarC family protein [Kiritimatiellales bacterium]